MSISLVRSNSTLPVNRTPAHTFSGKVHTPRNGCQYNQLSTSETVATYTKTDDDNQVTLNLDFGGKWTSRPDIAIGFRMNIELKLYTQYTPILHSHK